MKSCGFLHGCTSRRAKFCSLLSQFLGYFSFFLQLSLALHHKNHGIVWHYLLSLALTRSNPQHCSVVLSRLLFSRGLLFRELPRHIFVCNPCSLPFSFTFYFSETYLETLDQPLRSFIDMANRNVCFSDLTKLKTAKERWHSLVSRMGDGEENLETPLPLPPSSYGRSLTRSLARSYADVITKFSRRDGLPIFLTHGASLARFAR